jgi:hypothetical protein
MTGNNFTDPDSNTSNPDGTESKSEPPSEPEGDANHTPEDSNYSNPDGTSSCEPPPETEDTGDSAAENEFGPSHPVYPHHDGAESDGAGIPEWADDADPTQQFEP